MNLHPKASLGLGPWHIKAPPITYGLSSVRISVAGDHLSSVVFIIDNVPGLLLASGRRNVPHKYSFVYIDCHPHPSPPHAMGCTCIM